MKVMDVAQASQGSTHSPELMELKKRLDTILRHRAWILAPACSQELDLMTPEGLNQLGIFHGSMMCHKP